MADQPKTPEWGKLAPTYSNWFVVSGTPVIVRVSFGEGFGNPEGAVFHTAVAMAPDDAIALANSILDTVRKIRQPAQPAPPAGG